MKNFLMFLGTLTVAVVLAMVIWSYADAYDKVKPAEHPALVDDGHFTYIRVVSYGTALGMAYVNVYGSHEGSWEAREVFWKQRGSGAVVKDGFILTAAHVIIPDEVHTTVARYHTYQTKTFRMLTRTILIYGITDQPRIARVHYIDEELDIAILSYKSHGVLIPLNYPIEYAGFELRAGDIVFSYLHVRDKDGMGGNVRPQYGIVLSPSPTTPKMGSSIAWFNPFDITLSMPIVSGDSGSPLFAFRYGEPVLIGILRAKYTDGIVSFSYAVTLPRINRYLKLGRIP